jgi:hydroxymethylbilane synthase
MASATSRPPARSSNSTIPAIPRRKAASTRPLVLGTRGSKLALRQVEIVANALREAHPDLSVEVREIRTEGDRSQRPLSEIGGAGVFTKAIEDALLAGTIDIAVHSMKDLPPQPAAGLHIAAVPQRADARDALVTRGGVPLASLPPDARVGTGSARRAVQLLALRGDLQPVEIRGNVDTRLRKLDAGEYDAIVLAAAGLERLGLLGRATQIFSVQQMVPSPGQGALAVQVRADANEAAAFVAAIDDPATHAAVTAERAFLARLGAGCRLPVGAFAEVLGDTLSMRGMVAPAEGQPSFLEVRGSATQAAALGEDLARALLEATVR